MKIFIYIRRDNYFRKSCITIANAPQLGDSASQNRMWEEKMLGEIFNDNLFT